MNKIIMTDGLKSLIKTNRKAKNLTVLELSKAVNKGKAYISQLESGKISRVDEDLLRNILDNILDDESSISAIIRKAKSVVPDDIKNGDERIEIDEIKSYKSIDELVPDKKTYDKMVNILINIFESLYEHEEKKAFITLSAFLESCRSDLGFILAIMGIPYFKLEKLSHEEKQNLLNETAKLYKSHLK